jgi:PEP-CTERM motif
MGYDQLRVSGAGRPGGALIQNSDLVVHVGTTLTVGDQFTIAHHNQGFEGEFAQRGIVVADNGDVFTIAYTASGDIILTLIGAPVPEPSTWVGGVLAIAGLAFTQRRRLRKLITRRCAVGS